MISKIILTTLALFIGYNIWLHLRTTPSENQPYSYWVKDNHAKAQKYLQPDFHPSIVLCGTSLSSVMTTWLPDSVHDLSIVGGSWLTGLELIHQSQKLPNQIGIEVNFLLRTEDKYITEDALHSDWKEVRNFIPSFYAFNQPFDILSSDWQKGQMQHKMYAHQNDTADLRKSVFNSILPEKIKEYNEPLDSALSIEMREYIFQLASELEKKGCKVFLYLIPMDTALLKSQRVQVLLKNIERLPYPLILPDANYPWKTSDTEHLKPEHALVYTRYLLSKIG